MEEYDNLKYQCWLTGAYVKMAVAGFLDKRNKYPDNPLEEKQVIVEDMELTEEEKEMWREKLFAKLHGMAQKNKKNKNERDG